MDKASGLAYEPIPVLAPRDYYELSDAQMRLWITTQMGEEQTTFNLYGSCRMEGSLDISRFEAAFKKVIDRHEILRTTYSTVEGMPVQVVQDRHIPEWHMPCIDISEETDQERKIEEWTERIAGTVFDLDRLPLIQATLLLLGNDQYRLLFVTHHIAVDGWSLEVMVQELLTVYRDLLSGRESTLPVLSLQYKDYAAWRNSQLQAEQAVGRFKAFWAAQFAEGVPQLLLATDLNRTEQTAYDGGTEVRLFEPALTTAIYDLAASCNVGVFSVLLTAVTQLLYRYTGQKDMVIGIPLGGRDRPELEPQIGFYTNMIPFRSRFNAGHTLKTLLVQTEHDFIRAYEHGIYPYNRILELLTEQKRANRNSLFDVMLRYQDFDMAQQGKNLEGGLHIQTLETDDRTSKFDLTFAFEKWGEQLRLCIVYNANLFLPGTVAGMNGDLATLIGLMVQDPESTALGLKKALELR